MKYILLLLSFSLLGGSQLQAQVPGYQGNRFFVEAGATLGFNSDKLSPLNKGNRTFPDGEFTSSIPITARYALSANYVMGRNLVVSLGYEYNRAGLFVSTYTEALDNSNRDQRDLFYQVHMHDINLSVDLYHAKPRNLAPVGGYWSVGLRIVPTAGVLKDERVIYGSGAYPDNIARPSELAPLQINPTFVLVGPTLKYGLRTVLANKITFSANVQTTIFFQSLPLGFIDYNDRSPATEYKGQVILAGQQRYSFGAQIGFGILLF